MGCVMNKVLLIFLTIFVIGCDRTDEPLVEVTIVAIGYNKVNQWAVYEKVSTKERFVDGRILGVVGDTFTVKMSTVGIRLY